MPDVSNISNKLNFNTGFVCVWFSEIIFSLINSNYCLWLNLNDGDISYTCFISIFLNYNNLFLGMTYLNDILPSRLFIDLDLFSFDLYKDEITSDSL